MALQTLPERSRSIVVTFGVGPSIADHESLDIDGGGGTLTVVVHHGTGEPGNIVAAVGLEGGHKEEVEGQRVIVNIGSELVYRLATT